MWNAFDVSGEIRCRESVRRLAAYHKTNQKSPSPFLERGLLRAISSSHESDLLPQRIKTQFAGECALSGEIFPSMTLDVHLQERVKKKFLRHSCSRLAMPSALCASSRPRGG